MASIMLKDVPDDLHAQLKQEASAHFRSLDGEVLARIQHSFEVEDRLNTQRDQKWIEEALASGPEEPLSREEFDAAFRRAVKRHTAKAKAR